MRPIKFRQPMWDKHNKFAGWHYWGFIDDGFSEPVWSPESSVKEARQQSQQFTGLHDKNGREIYGGDIVKFGNNKFGSVVKWNDKGFYQLWRNGMINWKIWKEDDYCNVGHRRDLEVIGNATENPELIEEKK